jgi:hypothetical protein
MLGKQYPDVRPVDGTVPQVGGKILVNGTYELTDGGEKVHRRYTYFFSGRTAFVVECSAPPTQLAGVLTDCDAMLASLQPGSSPPQAKTTSDETAVAALNQSLPTLIGAFPPQWKGALKDVTITPASSTGERTLEIALAFDRPDIGGIYEATKTVLGVIKAGGSAQDMNKLPMETQLAAKSSGDFIRYLGEVWGSAWTPVVNCDPPIQRFKLRVLDANGRPVGSLSISREDGAAILSGKVTASEGQRIAGMYTFE